MLSRMQTPSTNKYDVTSTKSYIMLHVLLAAASAVPWTTRSISVASARLGRISLATGSSTCCCVLRFPSVYEVLGHSLPEWHTRIPWECASEITVPRWHSSNSSYGNRLFTAGTQDSLTESRGKDWSPGAVIQRNRCHDVCLITWRRIRQRWENVNAEWWLNWILPIWHWMGKGWRDRTEEKKKKKERKRERKGDRARSGICPVTEAERPQQWSTTHYCFPREITSKDVVIIARLQTRRLK